MMGDVVESVAGLLCVAAVVAMAARRLRFPYAVGLVLTGLAMQLLHIGPVMGLTRELLFAVLLPPLIFEAAMAIPWRALRLQLPVVLGLATLGVVLSAGTCALAMVVALGWPPAAALAFATLIAATDPVSVIAAFRESGVQGRLRTLIEAESLVNDGTAAVLFGAAVAWGGSAAPGAGMLAGQVLWSVAGGIACGLGVALLASFLSGRAGDALVETTFTVVAAYGSFLLAEHVGASGVVATMAAGLHFGVRGKDATIAARDRGALNAFWDFVAFGANSIVFLLIGMEQALHGRSGFGTTALVAILAALASRAINVYPVAAAFHASALRIGAAHQHLLVWGGLRGALALALALGLPPAYPYRDAILGATYAVVAFSVIVQGLSFPYLLRRFGGRGGA
jgi:CPA1 family monovalent cation:H+ antiporter